MSRMTKNEDLYFATGGLHIPVEKDFKSYSVVFHIIEGRGGHCYKVMCDNKLVDYFILDHVTKKVLLPLSEHYLEKFKLRSNNYFDYMFWTDRHGGIINE